MIRFLTFTFLLLFTPLRGVSLQEKVGALLMAHFHGEEANQDSQRLIDEAHVGGFLFYNWSNGLTSKAQVKKLCSSLQKSASYPLLLAIDQEGGRVSRLKEGFYIAPSPLTQASSPHQIEETAYRVGQELREVGITMNFAPVVDVLPKDGSSPIGDRAYSSNPQVVAACAKNAVAGYLRAGVIPVLKHFPGHGRTTADSHETLPVLPFTKQELIDYELYPYRTLSSLTPAIMTAHILVPALDTKNCATTSSLILQNFLRNEIGFQGIIVTDSLVMEGLVSRYPSVADAAVAAINAGCDLIVLGGKLLQHSSQRELSVEDILTIHKYIVESVKKGDLSERRIDEAYDRVRSSH